MSKNRFEKLYDIHGINERKIRQSDERRDRPKDKYRVHPGSSGRTERTEMRREEKLEYIQNELGNLIDKADDLENRSRRNIVALKGSPKKRRIRKKHRPKQKRK